MMGTEITPAKVPASMENYSSVVVKESVLDVIVCYLAREEERGGQWFRSWTAATAVSGAASLTCIWHTHTRITVEFIHMSMNCFDWIRESSRMSVNHP
jgi:hypothetical protein